MFCYFDLNICGFDLKYYAILVLFPELLSISLLLSLLDDFIDF